MSGVKHHQTNKKQTIHECVGREVLQIHVLIF
jgi:hypothetical protein